MKAIAIATGYLDSAVGSAAYVERQLRHPGRLPRLHHVQLGHHGEPAEDGLRGKLEGNLFVPVSYTHLTLPTN